MIKTKLPLYQIRYAFTITLASLSFMGYARQVLAQPEPLVNTSAQATIRFNDKEPDGSSQGRPSGREGTGSRGGCPAVNMPLSALVPLSNLGLAVEEHPTLWFFVPYQTNETPSGEFVLQDEQSNDIYRTSFTLPGKPGVVSFSLTSAAPLKMNKKYQWYFKLYCTQQKFANPVFVHGWVQRVALKPEPENQSKLAATERERIALYAKNGIWQTAVTELAKLRLAEPQNATFANDWVDLLRDVGLEKLAREPFVGSITANSPPERKEPRNRDFRK